MGRSRAGRRGRGSSGEESEHNDERVPAAVVAEESGGRRYVKLSNCIYDRIVVRLHDIIGYSSREELESISETIAYSLNDNATVVVADAAAAAAATTTTNDGSNINDDCGNGHIAASYPSNEEINVAARTLVEYFAELSFKDAEKLIRDAALDAWDVSDDANTTLDKNNEINTNNEIHDDDDDDDDGEYVGEGECALCERNVKLTRHHLVPKSTWPKMKKRLWNAASIIEELEQHSLQLRDVSYYPQGLDDDDEDKREFRRQLDLILGDRFDITYLPTTITNDTIRNYLARVCHLCRQCHSAVHRIHSSEWELATEYNTMERLLECKEILKFGAWASKQRCGRLTK